MPNYTENLTAELRELLEDLPDKQRDKIILLVKKKVVESFKNGLSAAQLIKAHKNIRRMQQSLGIDNDKK